jgi:hypothetical protein
VTYLLGISVDITERRRFEKERQFLAEANVGAVRFARLRQTLATVPQLGVRDFADWCIVDIIEEHENVRRLKVRAQTRRTAQSVHASSICVSIEIDLTSSGR